MSKRGEPGLNPTHPRNYLPRGGLFVRPPPDSCPGFLRGQFGLSAIIVEAQFAYVISTSFKSCLPTMETLHCRDMG